MKLGKGTLKGGRNTENGRGSSKEEEEQTGKFVHQLCERKRGREKGRSARWLRVESGKAKGNHASKVGLGSDDWRARTG